MPPEPDRLATAIENLAHAIEGNTQEMKALRDTIDDLRIEYQYAIRNSECPYLVEAKQAALQIPETLACANCDVDSPSSLAAALQEGWTRLCRDDGSGWNYLGVCPSCQEEEREEERRARERASEEEDQKGLF